MTDGRTRSAEDLLSHLDNIEKEVRRARGEPVERTPWDFNLPTGADFREMRETCELTPQEVADELDYTRATIYAIENGNHAPGREFVQGALRLYKREWPR